MQGKAYITSTTPPYQSPHLTKIRPDQKYLHFARNLIDKAHGEVCRLVVARLNTMKVFHFLTTLEWCQTANPSLYRIELKGKWRRGDVRHRTQSIT